MSALLVFALAAGGTYLIRISMVVSGVGERLDSTWTARLSLIAPTMLSAIVASSLFLDRNDLSLPAAADVVAVIAAALAVRRSGSLAVAFVVGFPVYWSLGLVL